MPREESGEMSVDAEGRPRWGRRAAGLLIQREDTLDFLLVLRSEDVMDPHVLGIPGGRVEPGESEEAAAVSEAREELGALPELRFVDKDVYTSGEFTYTTFLVMMSAADAKKWTPELNWENDAWVWVDPDGLREVAEVHPNVRKVIEKWS